MCTVSWLRETESYELLFNRDEQRSRKIATPPQALTTGENPYLAALDGEAGGTWLAVNQHGLTAAILNYYSHDHGDTNGTPLSRGRIPGLLMHLRSAELAEELLRAELAQSPYRPFLCVVLDQNQALLYTWNGKIMERSETGFPLSTSGFDSQKVESGRLKLFETSYRTETLNADRLLEFHTSHIPEKGPYSVCMHREDACSRSLSRVRVDADRVTYDYCPTSPCQAHLEPWHSASIARG